MYTGKIGQWDHVAADIANEIAAEYATGHDDEYIAIQARAIEILGGAISEEHTWEDFDAACSQAAEELENK
jgi:hypothetical protein